MGHHSWTARSVLLGACLVLGCLGTVEPGASGSSSSEEHRGGSGGAVGTGPSIPSPDTGIWRLTKTEYNNTLRDLLFGNPQAGFALPPDSTLNSDSNNFYF